VQGGTVFFYVVKPPFGSQSAASITSGGSEVFIFFGEGALRWPHFHLRAHNTFALK